MAHTASRDNRVNYRCIFITLQPYQALDVFRCFETLMHKQTTRVYAGCSLAKTCCCVLVESHQSTLYSASPLRNGASRCKKDGVSVTNPGLRLRYAILEDKGQHFLGPIKCRHVWGSITGST
jgi:hypothetical protein